jgi:hypothetical protein
LLDGSASAAAGISFAPTTRKTADDASLIRPTYSLLFEAGWLVKVSRFGKFNLEKFMTHRIRKGSEVRFCRQVES